MAKTVLLLLGSSDKSEVIKAISQEIAKKGVIVFTEIVERKPEKPLNERDYHEENLTVSTQIIFCEKGYSWTGFKNLKCPIYFFDHKTSAEHIALQVH